MPITRNQPAPLTLVAAQAQWAGLTEKFRKGMVGKAFEQILAMQDAAGYAPLQAVLEALYPGEPLDTAAEHIAKVKSAAAEFGRNPRISLSLRPILADTDELAWARAYDILARIKARTGGRTPPPPSNVGSQRLLEAASRGDVLDRCLFLPLATATGAPGNSTALVGSPETVAQAMLDYIDIGVDTLLIRGYEPFADTIDYGNRLLPLVRAKAAARTLAAV